MQGGDRLRSSRRRAEQDARDAHLLKRGHERADPVRVTDERLDAGSLQLLGPRRVARRPAYDVTFTL